MATTRRCDRCGKKKRFKAMPWTHGWTRPTIVLLGEDGKPQDLWACPRCSKKMAFDSLQ